MINVVWLNFHEEAPSHGYWCTSWLEEVFGLADLGLSDIIDLRNRYHFRNHLSTDSLPSNTGAIVVIPAEYNYRHVPQINDVVKSLPWAVVILASDEQGLFPVEDLVETTALWVMTPHFEKHVYPPGTKFMGEFYPAHIRDSLSKIEPPESRQYQAAFSGQVTHQRRYELVEQMSEMAMLYDTYLNTTKGFTQGLGHEEYAEVLVDTTTAPAPSGPVTLDSFRAFEALEAGAIPILDLQCPRVQNGVRYWKAILGDHPLPMVSHWLELPEILDSNLDNNLVFAWWQRHKRDTLRRILADVPNVNHGQITVLVATSPIASHPSTEIIEETIQSVRHHLPGSEIIIMIDGVRPEQEHYRERYTEYTRRLLWLCNTKFKNITPMLFTEHNHQANMTRAALAQVLTPTVLFMEHDTPLVTDRPIEWDEIIDLIGAKVVDMVRFHYEGRIHPEHEHLMLDKIPVNLDGVMLRRTVQWSQRPHLASTEYYRRIIREYFPLDNNTMIEDRMHSVAQSQPDVNRLAVYCPTDPDGSIVRSYHLDGRKDDPKFHMDYGSI